MIGLIVEAFQYVFGLGCMGIYGFHQYKHMQCKSKVSDIHKYLNDK